MIGRDETRQKGGEPSPSSENSENYRTGRRNSVTPKTRRKTTPETPIPVLYLNSFNKLPKWDFEDIYNRDAPPRPTVSALRRDGTRI